MNPEQLKQEVIEFIKKLTNWPHKETQRIKSIKPCTDISPDFLPNLSVFRHDVINLPFETVKILLGVITLTGLDNISEKIDNAIRLCLHNYFPDNHNLVEAKNNIRKDKENKASQFINLLEEWWIKAQNQDANNWPPIPWHEIGITIENDRINPCTLNLPANSTTSSSSSSSSATSSKPSPSSNNNALSSTPQPLASTSTLSRGMNKNERNTTAYLQHYLITKISTQSYLTKQMHSKIISFLINHIKKNGSIALVRLYDANVEETNSQHRLSLMMKIKMLEIYKNKIYSCNNAINNTNNNETNNTSSHTFTNGNITFVY
jgi:hypothetical protein